MKDVKDYYNKTATDWSNQIFDEKKQTAILSKFYDCFAEAGTIKPKILDLGCGAGYDTKILDGLGAKVKGVDMSEKLIHIARLNVPECKFFVGDIRDSLAKLGRFEGIICLATLIHMCSKRAGCYCCLFLMGSNGTPQKVWFRSTERVMTEISTVTPPPKSAPLHIQS